MKKYIVILFVLGAFCGFISAKDKTKTAPVRVACIGNSVTYGTGLKDPAADSYPTQLGEMLGDKYIVGRFGKPGATLLSKGYRPYNQQQEYRDALAFKPDIAVIHLGLNDTDPRAWPGHRDEFVRDYLALIDTVKAVNPKCRIILARMTPIFDRHKRFESGTRDWHAEIQTAIETVAQISGCQLIDFYEPLHCHPDWFPDALHPNCEGYGILAQVVYEAITGDYGGLKLPPSFSDHMVLPRDKELTIEGIADAGEEVTVNTSPIPSNWRGDIGQQRTKAGADGRWSVTLSPISAGTGYTLTISTKKKIVSYTDVAFGEVWLCSGQSNMAFKISQSFPKSPLRFEGMGEVSGGEGLRLLNYQPRWETYDYTFSDGALDSINHLQYFTEPQWEICDSMNASGFSAVGYYFARALRDSLQCPVGIICNAVGGSGTEDWVDRTSIETEMPAILKNWTQNDFIQDWVRGRALKNIGENHAPLQRHPYEPCYLYEASIRELRQLPINGVIWYQGESNAHNKEAHAKLFDMLVRSWRKAWNDPNLPFYYVQLSSLNRPEWTWFRDSQRLLMNCEPHLGMAVSSDIGDSTDVHPRNKYPLGERLVRWALYDHYGRKDVTPSGPLYDSMQINGSDVLISFLYANGLHTSDGQAPRTFEVAEYEGLYYPAVAEIAGDKIHLSCAQVSHPRYVRYGWQPYTRANLVNGDGLPASTFRGELR